MLSSAAAQSPDANSGDSDWDANSDKGPTRRTTGKAKARRVIESDDEDDDSPAEVTSAKPSGPTASGKAKAAQKDDTAMFAARDQRRVNPVESGKDEPAAKKKKLPSASAAKPPLRPSVSSTIPLIKKPNARPAVAPPTSGDVSLSSIDAFKDLLKVSYSRITWIHELNVNFAGFTKSRGVSAAWVAA